MTKGYIKKINKLAEELEPVYRLLEWRWRWNPNSPTRTEIRDEFYRLYSDLIADRHAECVSTGGLKASRDEEGIHFSFEKSVSFYK